MSYLTHACITMAAVAFVGAALLTLWSGDSPQLQRLLAKASAAAAIPTSIALLWCSYHPTELRQIGDFQFHLCIAALVLGYTSLSALFAGNDAGGGGTNQGEGDGGMASGGA